MRRPLALQLADDPMLRMLTRAAEQFIVRLPSTGHVTRHGKGFTFKAE